MGDGGWAVIFFQEYIPIWNIKKCQKKSQEYEYMLSYA